MSNPYRDAAWSWRKAGWLGVIPIGRRPGEKSPPPTGYTGYAGADPSGADIQAWSEGPEGAYNVGIHVPEDVYVLDIDARDGKPGEASAEALGPFPPTWSSTARGPGQPCRQLWFRARLPEGRTWLDHPGPGLDALHVGHRYAVVWPSTNPDAGGALYRSYDPTGAPHDGPIPIDELPTLPAHVIERLSKEGIPLAGTAAGDADTRAAIAAFRRVAADLPPCPRVVDGLRAELDRIALALTGKVGLHDPGALYSIVAYGVEGHVGVPEALGAHHDAYVDARVTARGEERGAAAAAWWRQVRGAVGKRLVASGGAIADRCDCGGLPVIPPFELPPDLAIVVGAAPAAPPAGADLVAMVVAAPPEERATAARALARAVADWPNRGDILAALVDQVDDVTRTELEREATHARRLAREASKVEAARRREAAQAVAVAEGTDMPDPGNPLAVARRLAAEVPATDGVAHVVRWRGDWYRWEHGRWSPLAAETVRRWVWTQTEHATFEDARDGPVEWSPTTGKVDGVLDALGSVVLHRSPELDDDRCTATLSGVLDLATRTELPHSPHRFNLSALPFAYDPGATAPRWDSFLAEVVPDQDSRAFLQEWFGYVVSGRTDQQKICSLIGRPRSGKGTVLKIMSALVGAGAVALSMSAVAQNFGLAHVIGKSLATFGDVRWKPAQVIAEAVPRLLSISGEDAVDVDRKNRPMWNGTLAARLVLASNDEPSFTDASGALASRMIHVRFVGSALGREDLGLAAELLAELPGIFNWSLDGLDRLTANGRFVEPAQSKELTREVRRSTSTVAAFADDCLRPDPTAIIAADILYQAYTSWARTEGTAHPIQRNELTKALKSHYGAEHVTSTVSRALGPPQRVVTGLGWAENYKPSIMAEWLGSGQAA